MTEEQESAEGTGVSGVQPVDRPLPTPEETSAQWSLTAAFVIWLLSLILSVVIPLIGLALYFAVSLLVFKRGLPQTGTMPAAAVLMTLVGTFVAQVVTVVLSWPIVTRSGRFPYLASLGWRWHPQFKWVHAVALAIGMLLVGILFEKTLPHHPTDFEKLLQLGTSVRVAVALLATLGAPFMEELVYRGLLYSALERRAGVVTGVAVVTLLFAGIHLYQYWGSPATIAAIFVLSLALTTLRAWTGSLLPCVATHFIFNGIQSVIIVLSPPSAAKPEVAPKTALAIQHLGQQIGQWSGMNQWFGF